MTILLTGGDAPLARALAAALRPSQPVRLFDAQTGDERGCLPPQGDTVACLAVSPDGRSLLTGQFDSTVRLWDLAAGVQRAAFDWEIGQVRSVAFAPGGMTAAAGGDAQEVVLWDLDDR